MGAHKLLALRTRFGIATKQFGMQQIDRTDIQRRLHTDPPVERDQPLDEIEAGASEIEAAVDMRRLDVEKARRIDGLREFHQQTHRKGLGLAMLARKQGAIEVGKNESHAIKLTGDCRGGNRARTTARSNCLDMLHRIMEKACTATSSGRCAPAA